MRVLEVVSPSVNTNLGADKYYKGGEGAINTTVGCQGDEKWLLISLPFLGVVCCYYRNAWLIIQSFRFKVRCKNFSNGDGNYTITLWKGLLRALLI